MVKAIDDCNLDDYLNLLHENYILKTSIKLR